jgi:uncharacterized membrane protein
MAISQTLPMRGARDFTPVIRKIGLADLRDALRKGYEDFEAMPTHAAFLVVIYPIIGLVLARATMSADLLPLLYPLAGGFALIGPLAAIGLYEMSRRREAGLEVSARNALDVVKSPAIVSILELGLILMLILILWLAVAQGLYSFTFGNARPTSITGMVSQIMTSQSGLTLIILGNAAGCLFAALALTISVVSFPLLLDKNVGVGAAVRNSVRAVAANPLTMLAWGIIVGAALFLGSLMFFAGLIFVLPVLGHATWHLYRKVVAG